MAPLILLGGMNCTADLWTGCGLDDALTPTLGEESIDAQVDRLLSELPPLFLLGGLSLGAIVAMAVAVRAPERVAGLVLISTNAKAPTEVQRAGWRHWIQRLAAGETPRDLQFEILPGLLSARGRRRPDLVERALAMGEETGPRALNAQLRAQSTRSDLRQGLSTLTVPTLIVSGAADTICPPPFHAEIAACMPSARMVGLDGGHLLPMEQPEAVGDLVRTWRSRVDPA